MARPECEVEMLNSGVYDVRWRGRALGYDQDLDEALRLVKRQGCDEYVLIEPDGYRTVQRL